jgi:hypothetical protein
MKVCDFDAADRRVIQCPACGRESGRQRTDIRLELPADCLLIRYVVRFFCMPCTKVSEAQSWSLGCSLPAGKTRKAPAPRKLFAMLAGIRTRGWLTTRPVV